MFQISSKYSESKNIPGDHLRTAPNFLTLSNRFQKQTLIFYNLICELNGGIL